MNKYLIVALFLIGCGDSNNDTKTNNNTATNNGTLTNNGTTNSKTNNSNNGTTNNSTGTTNQNIDYTALVINEVAPAGDPEDWFEIYNTGDVDVDLTGIGMTDDLAEKRKSLLSGSLAPGAYLQVVVSTDGTGFKLGRDEELGLFAPDGTEIDSVDWEDGDAISGKSFGRFPDGTGAFKTLNAPTPGAANVDNDPNAPVCGDMTKEGDEVCDGTDFGDQDCTTEGFSSGTLTCAPGCAEFLTTSCLTAVNDVRINEVDSTNDRIELLNTGDAAIDLAGWYVVDAGYASPADIDNRYDFPVDARVAAGEFLVLTKDVEFTFGLGGQDSVLIYDANDDIIDQVTWPDGEAAISYCRATDGDGDFQSCSSASFGATNTP